ncbi:hypothetical protein GF068_35410 [Polyangium spumosum]|uniref:Pre-toxin TG domain-containing protein n=1 Tax=Polyangium spumosum TaxID=889282 RepID=A0A6N7Q046_9BACT|nr:hypothetical protein [Polyangium spumosum]
MDGVLRTAFGPLAEEMKDNLNQWDGFTLNLEETQLVETIRAFAGAVSAVDGVVGPYVEVMQTLVHATTRIGIGFVPYVGPALDLCEAVTGKRFCLPGGEELSTEERIFSGVGFGFGKITKAWAGIKAAGVQPGAKVVAAGVLKYNDEFLKALQGSRRRMYKNLVGEVTTKGLNEFEGKAGLYLMNEQRRQMLWVGDDIVKKKLKIPGNLIEGLSRAPDLVTVTKGNKLALSEIKGGGKVDIGGDVLPQLNNALLKLKEANLLDEVDRIEVIMAKGAKFKNPNHKLLDGYVVSTIDGNKPVKPEDFNIFLKVIQL